mgnify:CR=1 FL=1
MTEVTPLTPCKANTPIPKPDVVLSIPTKKNATKKATNLSRIKCVQPKCKHAANVRCDTCSKTFCFQHTVPARSGNKTLNLCPTCVVVYNEKLRRGKRIMIIALSVAGACAVLLVLATVLAVTL